MRFSVAECLHAPLETANDQTAVAWRGKGAAAAAHENGGGLSTFPVQTRSDDVLELDPADGSSRVYLVRSRERMDMPPAASWDGGVRVDGKMGRRLRTKGNTKRRLTDEQRLDERGDG